MPKIKTADGTSLYYEEVGTGTPIVFVHEFAGDYRQWEPQMRYFARTHRCVTYSQRGYPPSDVPDDPTLYGQDVARADVIALMDALGIKKAHVVGHSMGAYTAVHVGLHHPDRCISVAAAGCGWGSLPDPAQRAAMRKVALETSAMFIEKGMAEAARIYGDGQMRQTHKHKDPRGYAEFLRMLSEHSALGHALTMSMLQSKRPTLWGPGSGLEEILAAAPHHRRRRRRVLPGRQRLPQAHGADRGPSGDPARGPHHHHRRAGRGQRGAGRTVRRGGSGTLDGASGAGVKRGVKR